jgi:hypothetical protein
MGADKRAAEAEQEAVIKNCRRDDLTKRTPFALSNYFVVASAFSFVARSRSGRILVEFRYARAACQQTRQSSNLRLTTRK